MSLACLLALIPAGLAQEAPAVHSARLANGVHLVVLPVPGVGRVAVEAFHPLGFVHDPAGLPQAAHLLEHLRCRGRTSQHAPGEASARLGRLGLANAETMADWTHYDYVVPAAELATVLQIEGARLAGVTIDAAIVAQEGPRCAQEVDFVERNPRAGMLKFGFMALAQAWRHGRDEARVRTGLGEYPVEPLQALWRQANRPDRVTLVIVGDCEADKAVALAEQHVGAVAVAAAEGAAPDGVAELAPIDWTQAPRDATVRWDSSTRVVCLWWPPPADPFERLVLSLWGGSISSMVAMDRRVLSLTHMVATPNHLWRVGELPFFVYAACREDADLAEVAAALQARLEMLTREVGRGQVAAMVGIARQVASAQRRLDGAAVERAVGMLVQRGQPRGRALDLVLGQGALDLGVAAGVFGVGEAGSGVVARVEELEAKWVGELVRRWVGEEGRGVVRLVGEEKR